VDVVAEVVGKEVDKEELHRDIVNFDSLTVQRPCQVRKYMIQRRTQARLCYDSENRDWYLKGRRFDWEQVNKDINPVKQRSSQNTCIKFRKKRE